MSNLPQPSLDPFAPPTANLDPRGAGGASSLASRGARFGAALLDGLVGAPFIITAMFIVASGGGGMAALQQVTPTRTLIYFACGLPLNILQWYLVATTGQTLGKRWIKTRIVKMDGSKVDFASGVALRYWPLVGLTLVCNLIGLQTLASVVGLIDPLFIFRGDRRTLHDLIAGTKVVEADLKV
jgi:uncharacterized RDD family membrane protein YckC